MFDASFPVLIRLSPLEDGGRCQVEVCDIVQYSFIKNIQLVSSSIYSFSRHGVHQRLTGYMSKPGLMLGVDRCFGQGELSKHLHDGFCLTCHLYLYRESLIFRRKFHKIMKIFGAVLRVYFKVFQNGVITLFPSACQCQRWMASCFFIHIKR